MSSPRYSLFVMLLLGAFARAQPSGPEAIPGEGLPTPRPADTPAPLAGTTPAAPATLTLEALQALGERNNPTLNQAIAQIEGVRGKALQAGLYPNPVVGYSAEQIGVEGTPGEFQGGFVRQEIVTANKLQLSRRKYLARADVAELMAVAQTYRVKNTICIQFFRVLGAGGLVHIERELLKTAEDNLVTRKEMYNVGQANKADVHQAEVELKQQQLRLKMAQNNYSQEWAVLSAVVGVPRLDAPLSGQLDCLGELIDWDQALERLLAESPLVLGAQAKYRGDQITVERERAEPIPNVVVQGAAGYNFEAKETVYGASVFLKVPLFDRNQGTIRQAEADLARQGAEIRRIRLDLQRQLGMDYRRYLTAYQHVQGYRTSVLPNARKAYEVTLQSYQEDRATWPEVLDFQHRYFDQRRQYIEHLVALRETEITINGLLLTDGLQPPPGVTPPGHIDAVPKPR